MAFFIYRVSSLGIRKNAEIRYFENQNEPALKRKLLLFSFLLSCISAFSQTGLVSGRLLDSTLSPVSYATVAVFDLRDSSVINFGLSDDQGDFELKGVPQGIPARLLVSHVLYQSIVQNFKIDTSGVYKMDTLILKEKQNELTETVVTWEAPPIVIRNDTVEFNADAFIGRPGSAVEDLLKKIPGVQIDENGVITYNGRRVSKITIDSKDFFANDPAILLKNIPAKAIDKVQVTREKDDRGLETESGEISINLTLKHWAKKSHFGKAYAGYGTDGRYEAGALWNLMRDTLQISLIGFGNNLSQAGFSFSDLYKMGGFERGGVNRWIMYSDGRMEANGLNLGGGEGIAESGALGFNLNYDIPKKLKLNVSYFFGLNRSTVQEDILSEKYLGDSTLLFVRDAQTVLKGMSHTFNTNIRWIPDTVQIIRFSPSLSWNGNSSDYRRSDKNQYESSPAFTEILNNTSGNSYGLSFHNNLSYNWKKHKNSFYIGSYQDYRNNDVNGLNQFRTIPFPDTFNTTENEQVRKTDLASLDINNYANYTRSFNDSARFTLKAKYDYTDGFQDVLVSETDSLTGLPVFINGLSTRFHYLIQEYTGGLYYWMKRGKGKLTINADLGQGSYDLMNQLDGKKVYTEFLRYNLRTEYEYQTMQHEWETEYSINQDLPYYWNMMDLVDNTDPNRVKLGNPNLIPSTQHSANLGYKWKNNSGTMYLGPELFAAAVFRNAISHNYYDEQGRRISQSVNLDSDKVTYNFGLSCNFSWRYKINDKWSLRPYVRVRGSQSNGFIMINGATYSNVSSYLSSYTSLNLSRKEKLELTFAMNPNFQDAQTPDLNAKSSSLNQMYSLELWYAPFEKIWIDGKITYWNQNFRSVSTPATTYSLWNMAVTYLVMKENRGQLRLSVFDVLGQNQNAERTSSTNELTYRNTNAVTRYFMLGFVYNFNSFQEKGRQKRGFSFWY